MKTYFINEDDEFTSTVDEIKDHMRFCGITELTVSVPKPIVGANYFFCREHWEVGEKGQGSCGNVCKSYAPRNGKNGRCKNNVPVYEASDKTKTVRL